MAVSILQKTKSAGYFYLQEISARFAGNFDFQFLLPGRKTFFLALLMKITIYQWFYKKFLIRSFIKKLKSN